MDMAPDEIVVRYRQAKEKGKQIKILADLNACSVDDIVHVLVEHGGYKLERMSRSRCKARLLKEEEEAPAKELVKAAEAIKDFDAALTKGQELEKQIPYKKPEIIPEPPKPIPVDDSAKYVMSLKDVLSLNSLNTKPQKAIDSALDVIKAEIEDINRQQYELDQRKADIYKKLWDMLGGVS